MTYNRPPFGDPGVKTVYKPGFFGLPGYHVPMPDYPISIKENFWRAAKRHNPVWVPNSSTDIQGTMLAYTNGMPEADFTRRERYYFTDWFGLEWMFVPEAGGPMLKPGFQLMDDITEWETKVKFPNLNDYDWKGNCERWFKTCDPRKVTQVNIGLGCTERLVSLMGGYTDAMLAMAMEPEAVRDFLEAFVEWDMKVIDKLCQYLPLDFVTYHDDWGTERDTFFSEAMMEAMVFEPTKKLFDYIHSKGVIIQHHSCGNIKRFMPYYIGAGVDFLQIQARANDVPALKAQWGDKIGFEVSIDPAQDKETLVQNIHKTVDTFAKGGGIFTSVAARDPELIWDGVMELYCYSRETYDRELEEKQRQAAEAKAAPAVPAFPGTEMPAAYI